MATERRRLDRPAFYALAGGGWRDLVTLLHPPYTAWHLSYVVIGAAAAPTLHVGRLSRRSPLSCSPSGWPPTRSTSCMAVRSKPRFHAAC